MISLRREGERFRSARGCLPKPSFALAQIKKLLNRSSILFAERRAVLSIQAVRLLEGCQLIHRYKELVIAIEEVS